MPGSNNSISELLNCMHLAMPTSEHESPFRNPVSGVAMPGSNNSAY